MPRLHVQYIWQNIGPHIQNFKKSPDQLQLLPKSTITKLPLHSK